MILSERKFLFKACAILLSRAKKNLLFIFSEFCKKVKRDFIINLSDNVNKTPSQMFIDIYKNLKQQGALSDEKIFEVAEEMLQDKLGEMKVLREIEKTKPPSLSASFAEAKNAKPINIKDIFRDE